ncbi:MAG: hypothetical protein AAF843_14645 [Bacteroidota bacterium]
MNFKTIIFKSIFFASLLLGIASCGDDDESPSVTGEANVRLLAVDVESNEIIIKNFGDASIDVSGFYICNLKSYAQLNTLTTEDLTLDPDETVSLDRTLDVNASDVALYFNNDGFASADNLADFMQYGADLGANGRIDVAVTKGIWTAGDFVEGNVEFDYTGNGSENGVSLWNTAGERGSSNVRIASVDPSTDGITLKNFGTASTDISAYQFCARKSYTALSSLTSEDLNLDPDEEITITFSINDHSSDVGLYSTGGDFTNADVMLDFIQYGDDIGVDGRVNVAVTKGIWSEGDYINGVGPYDYSGNGEENGLANWDVTEQGEANVRLFTVNPASDEVTLKNFGNASKDISSYWFCIRFSYNEVSTLSATSGNFILAPNEEITISVTVDDTSSDVGFYNTNSFASASAMDDFMQFGGSGIGRETVADTKGIWSAGDFVDSSGPFSYTGDGTTNGVSTWQ